MVSVIYLGPESAVPSERHIAVIVHRDPLGDKAYFYDTAKGDYGGSGPFDLRLDEAIERARRLAATENLENVVVRAKRISEA